MSVLNSSQIGESSKCTCTVCITYCKKTRALGTGTTSSVLLAGKAAAEAAERASEQSRPPQNFLSSFWQHGEAHGPARPYFR